GFLLGAFGQALALSDNVQIAMQLIAGLYMVLIALNLLNVHPIFRYVVIQPPRFLTKMVRNQSKSKDLFAPALLGLMTIFIPCGTTLAMEALAISSGNPFMGAAIMGAFTLGTMPLFFGLGYLTTALGDTFKARFYKIAAIAVLYLGITSVNGSLVAAGSPLTLQSLAENSPVQIDLSGGQASNNISSTIPTQNGIQTADITVYPNGYSPNYLQVKSGTPVKINLSTTDKLGCTAAFRIPSLGISKRLYPASKASVEFTPKNPGKIAFTCAMGMYNGVIEVI
ncbi:sulfite exporter TauE/SafE family protein, partial [Patescibacteria group bacterium]|nr:sulfite exporter TauE/SafE family protein [Patescibacteria group bacterium]